MIFVESSNDICWFLSPWVPPGVESSNNKSFGQNSLKLIHFDAFYFQNPPKLVFGKIWYTEYGNPLIGPLKTCHGDFWNLKIGFLKPAIGTSPVCGHPQFEQFINFSADARCLVIQLQFINFPMSAGDSTLYFLNVQTAKVRLSCPTLAQ